MKRPLRHSYRPSPAALRAQRQLARRSAALSLALLALLALAAGLWSLPQLFTIGSGGSFIAVPFEENEHAESVELPAVPPPDSPAPELAELDVPPPELLPLEDSEPVELALEEMPDSTAEPLLPLAEVEFRQPAAAAEPAAPTPARPAARPAAKPAVAASPAAEAGKPAGKLVAASYRSAPKPPYPAALRSSRIQGRVGVRIAVDATGRPTRVDITAPSGHAEFDSTARSWILAHWRFNPATRDGTPVPTTVTTRVEFVIS